MKIILSRLLVLFVFIFPTTVLAENNIEPLPEPVYQVYRLPKPLILEEEAVVIYTFGQFKLLLTMDNDLRRAEGDNKIYRKRLEETGTQLVSTEIQLANTRNQVDLCREDRVRLTEKWKKTEKAKNEAESRKRRGLFAVAGWTVAGVSLTLSAGLLLGLIAQ